MKIRIMMPVTIVIMMVFGVILAARGTLDTLDGQTNSATSTSTTPAAAATTTTAEEKASQSIRGAITETGEFLGNVTEKVVTESHIGKWSDQVLTKMYCSIFGYLS
jgi:hypothetical protein